jgi:hypothetical protein
MRFFSVFIDTFNIFSFLHVKNNIIEIILKRMFVNLFLESIEDLQNVYQAEFKIL